MKYSSQVTSKREGPPNPQITEVDNYTRELRKSLLKGNIVESGVKHHNPLKEKGLPIF